MESRARGGCSVRRRGEQTGMRVTFALLFLACANFDINVSANTTIAGDVTTQAPLSRNSLSSVGTSTSQTANPGSDRPATATPSPTSSAPTSPSPVNLVTTVVDTKTSSPEVGTTSDSTTTSALSTPTRPAIVSTSLATTAGSSKAASVPNITATSPGVKTPPKFATPAGYIVQNNTENLPTTAETTGVSSTLKGYQTKVTGAGTTFGSVGELTTEPQTVTSIVYDTSIVVVVETVPVDITGGEKTVEYVTLNATTAIAGGPGLNPDHEREELKKLLLIIGCSVGAAVAAILIVFAIVYRVAKRRNKKANSRYYNFKKKKSNYEKVLHLQEYYGELDTDVSSAGTGAAWVFQENEQDANKTITLELGPKDKERPGGKSGKKRSKNKNKNNRNKSAAGRGNYQVLAEMYPPTRNIPPDVLLSADGAVHSNSEDEEGAIMDTSFGPVMMQSEGKSDGLSFKDSVSDGDGSLWPAWNTRPYVTITPGDDAVVEL